MAREDDVPALVAIGYGAWERAVIGLVDAGAMGRIAELAFLSFLRQSWSLVSVIENDGAAAGWAAREDRDGTLSDLWIEPRLQGYGLGSALLADIEARIRAEGFDAVTLSTHAQNERAIAFFQKRDYAISWLLTAYSSKLDRNVDSVGMRKVLVTASVATGPEWF